MKIRQLSSYLLVLLFLISCSSPQQDVPPEPEIRSTQSPAPAAETSTVESYATRLDAVSGTVLDENEVPLPGAVVRVKATEVETRSDTAGRYILTGLTPGKPVFITAWVSGYFIHGVENVLPGSAEIDIVLHVHHTSDNPEYQWLPSTYHPGEGENQGCAECHSTANTEEEHLSLPVDEWLLDAHSASARNQRFLSMYLGQDTLGNQSPDTRYTSVTDYGQFPLLPDPSQPYYGPGYKLDFPDTAGNCAACHTPLPAANDPYGVDPSLLSGSDLDGISCDFCHKVWDIHLDPASGLPRPNMPGVLSYEFLRPPEGHQFFAGPLDDVAPGEDTYSPVQRESRYCAGCHYGVFWDTVIYNSFGEWLNSSYSQPDTGQTCQDCHMPSTGAAYFALPGQGGVARDPLTLYSHRMPGASDAELLENAVSMVVTPSREGTQVSVEVSITNDQTGHHVPTDSPLRQMILLVEASSVTGEELELLAGERVPDWGGTGNPEAGYYAGLPGKGYAKILIELWTQISPTGSYWNPTGVLSDNRLAAFATDTSTWVFTADEDVAVDIRVQLLFRRAFIELMDQKAWDTPDILMEMEHVHLP